uniref:Uncharacterized protein n=1 Tax=Acrobeloides nanus TaxID=290746 RepID=A0A914CTU8_9BILA
MLISQSVFFCVPVKKEKETEIRELLVNREQAMQEILNIKQAFDEQKESMHILKTDFDKVDEDNKILIKGMSDKEAEISRLKEDLLQAEQSASNLIKSSRDAIDEARRSKEELEKAVLGRQEMERKIAVEKSEMKQKILTLKQEWETLVKQNYKREMTTATEHFRSMLSAQNLGFLEFKALEEWDDRSFSIPESSSISRASSSFDVVSDVDSVRTLEEEKNESP